MRRAEAVRLLGQQVEARTAANGVYVGELVEVTDSSPWRGKVRIDGVLEPALAWERSRAGRPPRCGFRPGETVEVGGSSIKATTKAGVDYEQALRLDLDRLHALKEADAGGRDGWWLDRSIAVRERQLDV